MKSNKTSFLFFCFLFCLLFVGNKTHSQLQSIDSSKYYNKLYQNPRKNEDLNKALTYFKEKQAFFNKSSNKLLESKALINIAQIQKKIGYLTDSEKTTVDALKLLDAIKGNDSIVERRTLSLYNHLGKIYREYKNYDQAIFYYNEALNKTDKLKYLITIWNNIGYVYSEQEKYDLAIQNFKKAYENSLKISDITQGARALDNIGFAQSKSNSSNSLFNLEKALMIKKENNLISGVFTSYMHLAEYFKDRDNITAAIGFANKALEISDSTKSVTQKESALSLKVELRLNDDGDFIVLKNIRDSISHSLKISQNKYASEKYNYDKKESELNLLKVKGEKNQILFVVGVLFLLTCSLFLYFFLKSKHKKEKLQQVYNTETRISKKVHDELANDMSDVMSFVENDIETSANKKVALLNNLEDIYIRTRDISTETGSIDLINFSKSLKHLLMQHNKEGTKVVTNDINTINWKKVSSHKKMIVYRSLQELMVNMKKHSRAKFVSLAFKEIQHKKEIRYVDDGIGVTIEEINVSGLQNVESRIKGIGGNFNFISSKGNGFKAILKFNS